MKKLSRNRIILLFIFLSLPFLCFIVFLYWLFDPCHTTRVSPEIYQVCLSAPHSLGCLSCIGQNYGYIWNHGQSCVENYVDMFSHNMKSHPSPIPVDMEMCLKCEDLWRDFAGELSLTADDQRFFNEYCYEPNKVPPTTIITPTRNMTPTNFVTTSESSLNKYSSNLGFSFFYDDQIWKLSEETKEAGYPLPAGSYNQIELTTLNGEYKLIIANKSNTNDAGLLLYGGAAGDFVSRGTIDFLGMPLEKYALEWNNKDLEVHYNYANEITRDSIIFAISLDTVSVDYIPSDILTKADVVLESFEFE